MYHLDEKLDDLAWEMGISVITTGKLSSALNACYHHSSRIILVRQGLDPVTRRCALAHELGHAHYEDDCSTPQAELRADRWAASALITPSDLNQLIPQEAVELSRLSAELGVTPHLLRVHLSRRGAQPIP